MIHQLIYCSRNAMAGNSRELLKNWGEILASAHRRNPANGITGFLIFDRTWFVQVLEGERAKVAETYARIRLDPRHHSALVINVQDVRARAFENWSMGSALRTPAMEEIFLAQGIVGALDPSALKGAQVVQLARYLMAYDMEKQKKAG